MRETIDPETLDTFVEHHRRFLDFLERQVDDADRPARTTDNG